MNRMYNANHGGVHTWIDGPKFYFFGSVIPVAVHAGNNEFDERSYHFGKPIVVQSMVIMLCLMQVQAPRSTLSWVLHFF